MRIPSDTFHFFLAADNLVGARFGTLLAAMYTLVLAVLGASAVSGLLRIRWRALLLHTALTLAFILCVIGGVRVFFQYAVGQEYKKDQDFMAMELTREYPPASVHKSSGQPLIHDPQKSRVSEIRERGSLRIGYFQDALPFAFENRAGNLVGFDVEMAYWLARDMKVALEFVLIDRAQAAAMVNGGNVDLIMSGMAITLERAQEVNMSAPYLNET